jgi:hypothetical protein
MAISLGSLCSWCAGRQPSLGGHVPIGISAVGFSFTGGGSTSPSQYMRFRLVFPCKPTLHISHARIDRFSLYFSGFLLTASKIVNFAFWVFPHWESILNNLVARFGRIYGPGPLSSPYTSVDGIIGSSWSFHVLVSLENLIAHPLYHPTNQRQRKTPRRCKSPWSHSTTRYRNALLIARRCRDTIRETPKSTATLAENGNTDGYLAPAAHVPWGVC